MRKNYFSLAIKSEYWQRLCVLAIFGLFMSIPGIAQGLQRSEQRQNLNIDSNVIEHASIDRANFNQIRNSGNATTSNLLEECDQESGDFGYVLTQLGDFIFTDDLVVDSETIFHLEQVVAYVGKESSANFTGMNFYLFRDNNGKPGTAINIPTAPTYSVQDLGPVTATKNLYAIIFEFSEPLALSGEESESYWFGLNVPNNGTAGFLSSEQINGEEFYISTNNGASWISATSGYGGNLGNYTDLALDFYGQCEDIVADCARPTDIVQTGKTSSSAAIEWTAGGSESSWSVSWGSVGFTPEGTGQLGLGNTASSNFNITGLDSYTKYEVYVRAICGIANESSWRGPFLVLTLGDGIGNGVLSQSTTQVLTNAGVSCAGGDNWWMRAYSLDDHGINSPILITGMEFAISQISTPETFEFYAFDHPGFPAGFNLSNLPDPIASASMTVSAADAGQKIRVLFDAPAIGEVGATIVIAVVQTSVGGSTIYLATTADDMTPSYLASINCGIAVPATVDEINFSQSKHLINLVGEKIDYIHRTSSWTPVHPSGSSTSGDNIVIVDGSTSFSSGIDANNLTIFNDASLEISNVINLQGDLRMLGDVTFKSTATGNGELGVMNGTITGNATVERYMQDVRSYRMVSSAVTTSNSIRANWQEGGATPAGYGTHITGSTSGANGFDATQTGNPSMFTLSGDDWVEIGNTDLNTLNAGTPYLLLVRGDRNVNLGDNNAHSATTIRATGALAKGNKTQSFAAAPADEFVMFGNPYQSTVDVNALLAASTNTNTDFYYIYSPEVGTNGGYVTVTLPAGTNGGGYSANQYLQPGQGAMFTTAAAGASSVNFTEAMKAPGNHTSSSAIGDNDMINVRLFTTESFANGKLAHDTFSILFSDSYSNDVNGRDARKPMNFAENMAIDNDGTLLSIERREMPVTSEIYKLYTSGYTQNNYIFKVDVTGLDGNVFILEDNYTGSSTLLEGGETLYSFQVDESPMSRAIDRFFIRVESSLGVTDHALSGIRLFPNPTNSDTFYIHAPKLNGEQVAISIADMAGRQIYTGNLACTSGKITVDVNDTLSSGVYLVTVKFAGEAQTYRLIRE